MKDRGRIVAWGCAVLLVFLLPGMAQSTQIAVNAHSAILIDMTNDEVLFEQNADKLIPPASITKVLSLYLVFDAIRQGRAHLWDDVLISKRAAAAPPSRMGLKAGQWVPLDQLIKGMAVISGNDASIAVAEHVGGSVENFVQTMNRKARQLGMNNTAFATPNGLPAKGQLTTARDISKLSIAYLRRFPESLDIHSMQSYTYNNRIRRNANKLLGRCPGVDGLKTGFVCASGYNLSATAQRGNVRLLAVVMGAPNPRVRAAEAARMLEMGFAQLGVCAPEIREVRVERDTDDPNQGGGRKRFRITGTASARTSAAQARRAIGRKGNEAVSSTKASVGHASPKQTTSARSANSKSRTTTPQTAAVNGPPRTKAKAATPAVKERNQPAGQLNRAQKASAKPGRQGKQTVASATSKEKASRAGQMPSEKVRRHAKIEKTTTGTAGSVKNRQTRGSPKSIGSAKAKQPVQTPAKNSCNIRRSNPKDQESMGNRG